jgi:NADH-quinone oxidoreductase subunit G
MGVGALGIVNRGVLSEIAPNREDHLECDECGMCIDICPVGALTSGAYRYKTRPWEMNHIGTTCLHCADGCKTTLGVRRSDSGMEIVRGDNRDKSGINGDFLCIKGRYAFDFSKHDDRLTQPLIRKDGRLVPTTWEEAIAAAAAGLKKARDSKGANAVGVIGSNRTTNEENYLLQKFARTVLGTNNIDHHRTADFPAFAAALAGKENAAATMRDVMHSPAILLIGNDPTDQHPLVAWNIRTAVRLHQARLYTINSGDIKLKRQSVVYAKVPKGTEGRVLSFFSGDDKAAAGSEAASREALATMRDKLRAEKELVVIFGSELRGADIATLVKAFANAKFLCLADYANSRGAADMGLYPDLFPGYQPVSGPNNIATEWGMPVPTQPGMHLQQMLAGAKDGKIEALYIVGSNPVARYGVDAVSLERAFVVVQDMFLTETATIADVVLPACSSYEKSGTFTNTAGDLQQVKKAGDFVSAKPDFELIVRIADAMGADIRKLVPFGTEGDRADMGQSRGAQSGEADRNAVWLRAHNLEPKLSPFDPAALFDEIQRVVPGYDVPRLNLLAGNDVHTHAVGMGKGSMNSAPETIVPANDILFTSGTLGRYSNTLNSVIEQRRKSPGEITIPVDALK